MPDWQRTYEIHKVYRLAPQRASSARWGPRRPGVNINDKHVEVVSRQMMRWVRIEDVGDTEFLIDEQTDKFRFGSGRNTALCDRRARHVADTRGRRRP